MEGMRGFTLLELLTVLAITSVVFGFGVPTFNGVLKEQRLVGEANRLVAGLRLVRAEAARRGRPVSICPTTDGKRCSQGSDWSGGWLVFEDAGGSGGLDPGEPLIHAEDPVHHGVSIHADGDFADHVTFLPNGRLAQALAAKPDSAFRVCDSRGHGGGHSVTIGYSGRPQSDPGVRRCG